MSLYWVPRLRQQTKAAQSDCPRHDRSRRPAFASVPTLPRHLSAQVSDFHDCQSGSHVVQCVLVLAIAALILLGVRALGGSMSSQSNTLVSRLMRGDESTSTGGEPTPPDWNSTGNEPAGPGSLPAQADPSETENGTPPSTLGVGDKKLGEILPSLAGSLSNWKLRDAALTAAILSGDAYNSASTSIDGWDLVQRVNGRHDFNASIYSQTKDGQQVVGIAFRGTESAMDWTTDIWNVFFGSEQYLEAIKLVRSVQKQYPNAEIFLTGHSLGGGEAAYAAAMTGLPAISLNGAGPSYPHLASVGLANLIRRIKGHAFDRNIIHVNEQDDILTNSPAGLPWSDNVFSIDNPGVSDRFAAHLIEHLIEALRQKQPLRAK